MGSLFWGIGPYILEVQKEEGRIIGDSSITVVKVHSVFTFIHIG